MGFVIGIDDAGRGPVLGPMVLAGVLMDENEQVELKALDVKDSKLLAPDKRRRIGEKLLQRFVHHVEVSSPQEIDGSSNLNYLEAVKAAMIVNKLVEEVEGKVKVIIDCPSVNVDSWCADVQGLLKSPESVELVCEHKADASYPVVSAASILAKERREEEMFALRNRIEVDVGSGYPSDPKTKAFIKDNYDNPEYKDMIRFSWSTVKKLVKDKGQKMLF